MAPDPTPARRDPITYTLAFSHGEYAAIRAAARAAGVSRRFWMITTLVAVAAAPDHVARALAALTTTPQE